MAECGRGSISLQSPVNYQVQRYQCLTTVAYLWLTALSFAVKKADFSSKFNILHFFVCEVLPHCNMKCTNEEVFLGKAKESLDDVNSEPTIADIASGFGCIISY